MSNGPFYAEGAYMGEVSDVAVGESKNGHPQIKVKFYPTATVSTRYNDDGEIEADLTPTQRKYERTAQITIKADDERSMDFALMKLRAAGWEGESFRELDSLRGTTINLTCRHEQGTGDYSGKTFERWELPLPPRESEPLESDSSVARKLDALFGKKLKAPKLATTPPSAPSEPANPPSGSSDFDYDIPF